MNTLSKKQCYGLNGEVLTVGARVRDRYSDCTGSITKLDIVKPNENDEIAVQLEVLTDGGNYVTYYGSNDPSNCLWYCKHEVFDLISLSE